MSRAMSHECDIIMGFFAHWGVEMAGASSLKVFYTKVRQFWEIRMLTLMESIGGINRAQNNDQ
jgi:hypothetical protein